jgi:hypothetical protein
MITRKKPSTAFIAGLSLGILTLASIAAVNIVESLKLSGDADAAGYQISNLGTATNSTQAASLGVVTNRIALATGTNITSLGTVTNGTWQATPLGLEYGGTGAKNGAALTAFGQAETPAEQRDVLGAADATASADSTIFYDDFDRADTVDGTITPATSGQSYTTTGSGAANGRIVHGRLVSVTPFGTQYHYPSLAFTPNRVGVRFSYAAGPGTNSVNRGLCAILIHPGVGDITPMLHFVWDDDQWWLEEWDSSGTIIPILSRTYERKLKRDGTEYVIELLFDAGNDRVTVRSPDGLDYTATHASISDLVAPNVAWEQIYDVDPTFYPRFEAIWASNADSNHGPFMTASMVDAVRDNKGTPPVVFDNSLGSSAYLLAGPPLNVSAPAGGGSTTLQSYRTYIQQIASGNASIAVGRSSAATALNSTAIGQNVSAFGTSGIALGDGSMAGSSGAALGKNAYAAVNLAGVAIGAECKAYGYYPTAVGYGAIAAGQSGLAVGRNAVVGYAARAFSVPSGGTTITIAGVDARTELSTTAGATTLVYVENGITKAAFVGLSSIAYSGGNTTATISESLPTGITYGTVSNRSKGVNGIAIGNTAVVTATTDAVQIGTGTNVTSSTVQYLSNRIADTNGLAITGSNGVTATKSATGVALSVFSGTASAPTDTATPVAWVDIVINSTTYKMPLFQ